MVTEERKDGKMKQNISEAFEFRSIRPQEADEAVAIEQICFPPNEACSERHMKERIQKALNCFWWRSIRKAGKWLDFSMEFPPGKSFFGMSFLPT